MLGSESEQDEVICGNCRFYSSETWECRKRAPSPDRIWNGPTTWPPVNPRDWCGEFEWPRHQRTMHVGGKR